MIFSGTQSTNEEFSSTVSVFGRFTIAALRCFSPKIIDHQSVDDEKSKGMKTKDIEIKDEDDDDEKKKAKSSEA